MIRALVLAVAALSAPSFQTDPEISARHVKFLSDPKMEGRMTLSPQMFEAADYIADHFKKYGLTPLEKGSFFHDYPVTINVKPSNRNIATFINGRVSHSLALGKEFVPVVGTTSQILFTGPVAYIGEMTSGIRKEEVEGRWVALNRVATASKPETRLAARCLMLSQLGVKGVILVGGPSDGRSELPRFARSNGIPSNLNFSAVAMTKEAFEAHTPFKFGTPDSVQQSDVKFRAITDLVPNAGMGRNVIGMLPGNDPKLKSEFIIIGGHFDHLGYGEVGSRTGTDFIHYGADDNASGTSGVLALAEYFGRTKSNRRTLIFQAYSGEEEGLFGSRAWARDHAELLKSTQAMINMDMIGRLRDGALTVYCVNSAKEFSSILDGAAIDGVRYNKVMSSPGNSDHASFIAAGVPSLFFFTDMHNEYHTENDKFDTLNLDGLARVIEVVSRTIKSIDIIDSRLVFAAGPQQPQGSGNGSSSRRVRVGFIPNMGSEDPRGLVLNGATPGSPAESAGIRSGDILVKFGTVDIKSVEDLQEALSKAEAGKAVVAVIIRDGKTLEVTITPTAPQS